MGPATSRAPRPRAERGIRILSGPGAIGRLPTVLAELGSGGALVVTSAGTRTRMPLSDLLTGFEVRYWSDWSPNPSLDEALAAAALVDSLRPATIVGIGGASALDLAKLARCLPVAEAEARAALSQRPPQLRPERPPLLLAPTTAGPGAEVTRFAAVYVDGRKRSLDHEEVTADAVLLDPDLLRTCPREVLASCALDGLAQGVESLLALRATPASRRLATGALAGFVNLLDRLDGPPAGTLEDASRAGAAVGMAIDVSRTTAGHAFAYPLTAGFGVPHGLACALQLTWLLPLWHQRSRAAGARPDAGQRLADAAAALGVAGPQLLGAEFARRVEKAGFSSRLGSYGVERRDLNRIAEEALASERADNSPFPVGHAEAVGRMEGRL
jgi:alcohol dehydrogenase